MKTITRNIKIILEELQSELQNFYKTRFNKIILYGSYARGEATEDSDIDVVAVIEGIEDPMKELGKLSDIISQISLKYDTLISLYPISSEDFKNRYSPMLLNVRKEGISL